MVVPRSSLAVNTSVFLSKSFLIFQENTLFKSSALGWRCSPPTVIAFRIDSLFINSIIADIDTHIQVRNS